MTYYYQQYDKIKDFVKEEKRRIELKIGHHQTNIDNPDRDSRMKVDDEKFKDWDEQRLQACNIILEKL